ncbi:class I SAM-dependent methyltransferase [Mycolicibacterium flavescens]|uniref:Methyltransferase n=1 Tax=Mycolicibacterium flavescens TaxID=1776 RepID=A0A1E3RCN8_MYCFV|nr:class I SAM-dependent methyltransferase [Mycolicibacterium flavescens]MCV7280081.1 class I SAM-dependent methyltransferase [Mycolicibacterium flavescens]ODQ87650.1 methyltransferase [Mycolicibacterium flavescens]
MSEPHYERRTREGYDVTAAGYAERFHDHLRDKPLDRAVLSGFAGLIRPDGLVVDLGCGTGATSRILADYGVDVVGIDLSPNMIAEARRLNPDLEYRVGSMMRTDLPDGHADGVCAWYSTIHIPDDQLPQVFSEFHRILRPGGHALLAFQVGDQPKVLTEAFSEEVDLTFHRRRPEAVERLLADAGLRPYARLVRDADDDGLESTQQAYLIASRACAER